MSFIFSVLMIGPLVLGILPFYKAATLSIDAVLDKKTRNGKHILFYWVIVGAMVGATSLLWLVRYKLGTDTDPRVTVTVVCTTTISVMGFAAYLYLSSRWKDRVTIV